MKLRSCIPKVIIRAALATPALKKANRLLPIAQQARFIKC